MMYVCVFTAMTSIGLVWFPDLLAEGRGKGLVNYLQLAWISGISMSWT